MCYAFIQPSALSSSSLACVLSVIQCSPACSLKHVSVFQLRCIVVIIAGICHGWLPLQQTVIRLSLQKGLSLPRDNVFEPTQQWRVKDCVEQIFLLANVNMGDAQNCDAQNDVPRINPEKISEESKYNASATRSATKISPQSFRTFNSFFDHLANTRELRYLRKGVWVLMIILSRQNHIMRCLALLLQIV